jgi:hypothetical protein
MTTSTSAVGVAPPVASPSRPPIIKDTTRPTTVYIVGFAPSWPDTPWDDPNAHYWGMNALHKLAGEKRWDAWFQLHDIETSHPQDKDEHLQWLAQSNVPVWMWAEQIEKYPLPNAVPYPREAMVAKYGKYFTNTVSWMTALAIEQGYKKIGIYGVDMAQDSEYQSQRPSCEYFIGLARGLGIEVEIPRTSDLLKNPFLYGYDDGGEFLAKMRARLKELQERRAEMERQRNHAHEAALQIAGAMEDVQYWIRVWSQQEAIKHG